MLSNSGIVKSHFCTDRVSQLLKRKGSTASNLQWKGLDVTVQKRSFCEFLKKYKLKHGISLSVCTDDFELSLTISEKYGQV